MIGRTNILNERYFWVFRGFGEVSESYFFSKEGLLDAQKNGYLVLVLTAKPKPSNRRLC